MSDERSDEDDKGGFLSRWSRRKRAERAADAESAAVFRPGETVPDETPECAAVEPAPDPDALTPEEVEALPPVESAVTREELQVFLRKGVPGPLRNAALRRIWALNPKIANYLDVARDYAYDWNTPGGVPGSGGAISPAAALSMVERFLAPKPGVAEAEEPKQESAETAGGESAAAVPVETAAAADDGEPDDDNPQHQTLVLERASDASPDHDSASEKTPSRRHGGAVPR